MQPRLTHIVICVTSTPSHYTQPGFLVELVYWPHNLHVVSLQYFAIIGSHDVWPLASKISAALVPYYCAQYHTVGENRYNASWLSGSVDIPIFTS